MAIATTGAIYKSLVFDGEDSRNYGVYITGEAVYNAPEREVEMISIPGRSGAFALDKGRFENIEVTYPAGIFADNETDFASAISDFRNYLCSRKGYCRLVDEYNPEEYRMAIYKSGLDVSPAQLKAGKFDITFDCKPQRWLTSGEDKLTVLDGDTITNPTLFESSPLLEVKGYGTIGFNGYEIMLENAVLGDIILANKTSFTSGDIIIPIDSSLLESGDQITIGAITTRVDVNLGSDSATSLSVSDSDSSFVTVGEGATGKFRLYSITTTLPAFSITKGTTASYSDTVTAVATGLNTFTTTVNISISASDSAITITRTFTHSGAHTTASYGTSAADSVSGFSSKSMLGNPTYIDCDLGEAYRIDSDTITSLNQHIDLGSDLPKLASGANTIAYDNTITELKIIPRWWKV